MNRSEVLNAEAESVFSGASDWAVEQGDALAVLRSMPDRAVDVFMFSPPYWSLRSYLADGHQDKASEMGSEDGPGPFLDALLSVVDECQRVLTDHGTIIVNIGDTYAGSGGAGGDYDPGGLKDGQRKFNGSARSSQGSRTTTGRDRAKTSVPRQLPVGAMPKSLCGIPEALMWAMVWGRNPWTGNEFARWTVRNRVTWCKPSPPVGRDGDKFRPGSELLIMACKGQRRYWNEMEAVVEALPSNNRKTVDQQGPKQRMVAEHSRFAPRLTHRVGGLTAPLKDWWVIPSKPNPEAHFATYPPMLVETALRPVVPERVCRVCGKASEPVIERLNATGKGHRRGRFMAGRADEPTSTTDHPHISVKRLAGWTECDCEGEDKWRAGIVCDPFIGSGTTGIVARRLGRAFIGIELSAEYAEMARRRIERALLPDPKRSKPKDRGPQSSLFDEAAS